MNGPPFRPLLPNRPLRRSACGRDRRVLNGIFWVLRSYQIPLADGKSKPKSRRLTRSPLLKTQLAQWFCAAGHWTFHFLTCERSDALTSPPRYNDQGDAIDAAAGQHEIAVGSWHHVAHDSSARRDRPSLESFSLRVEAHEGVRILS